MLVAEGLLHGCVALWWPPTTTQNDRNDDDDVDVDVADCENEKPPSSLSLTLYPLIELCIESGHKTTDRPNTVQMAPLPGHVRCIIIYLRAPSSLIRIRALNSRGGFRRRDEAFRESWTNTQKT